MSHAFAVGSSAGLSATSHPDPAGLGVARPGLAPASRLLVGDDLEIPELAERSSNGYTFGRL
jgi:hypothetical protein